MHSTKIIRVTPQYPPSEIGTFGVLLIEDTVICATLECPWRENTPFVSCIPDGMYEGLRSVIVLSGKHTLPTFEILGDLLDGRTRIKFHPANWVIRPTDNKRLLKGCIAPGVGYGEIYGK